MTNSNIIFVGLFADELSKINTCNYNS